MLFAVCLALDISFKLWLSKIPEIYTVFKPIKWQVFGTVFDN